MARKITLLVLPILTAMFLTSSAIWTSHADDKTAGNRNTVKRAQLPAEALRSLAWNKKGVAMSSCRLVNQIR